MVRNDKDFVSDKIEIASVEILIKKIENIY